MKPHRIIRTKGQRIAWTNTSRIPDDQVVAAIKFVAAEINLDKVIVHFKGYHGGSNWGRAYPNIPDIANTEGLQLWLGEWRYLIVVRDHADWVATLGHEAKHIEQFRRGTIRRERRNRNCEAQCNAFGSWIGRKWRDHLDSHERDDVAC